MEKKIETCSRWWRERIRRGKEEIWKFVSAQFRTQFICACNANLSQSWLIVGCKSDFKRVFISHFKSSFSLSISFVNQRIVNQRYDWFLMIDIYVDRIFSPIIYAHCIHFSLLIFYNYLWLFNSCLFRIINPINRLHILYILYIFFFLSFFFSTLK